nr:hypothetical protein [Tanacetum cinerariifolium]
SNDVTRLQALVDKKKVLITEATIRNVLRLDDAEGVDCLPNEEIFAELARMGYEKPSTKLTFYKAFFSSQWKFLIHTILQSMSAKRTSWNEFSSTIASAVIYLSTGRKINFSKYIFKSLVRNVDSSSKFYMYPRFIQLIIQNQLGDLSTHITRYTSPALTQKVFANMRRVGKGWPGVETPLFEGMLVAGEIEEQGDAEEQEHDNVDDAAQEVDTTAIVEDVQEPFIPSPTPPPQPQDLPSTSQKRVKRLEKGHKVKVFKLRSLKKVGTSQRVDTSDDTIMEDVSNQGRTIDELDRDESVALMGEKEEEKKAEEEAVDVVTTAKLITEFVTTTSTPVSAASTIIPDAKPKVLAATIIVAPVRVVAASTRKRKGVVIKDPEEESTAKTPAETKSKDKGKGIMVEEPKPMMKKQQVELDEDKFNSNIKFLLKSNEQIEEEENRTIESFNETPAQKAAKRRKLNKEVKDVILLVEKRYPLSKFTLDQMLNAMRLQVEKQSEMSLELLRRIVGLLLVLILLIFQLLALELMLPWSLKKNTKCFNVAGEKLSDAKHKFVLLDTAAERRLMLLSQDKTVNENCCC